MDHFFSFLQGIFIGLVVAMPVGPVALLCMRRTLEKGFAGGILTGVGAALADLFFAIVAAFGMTALSSFIVQYYQPIQLVGGGILSALAVYIFKTSKRGFVTPNQRLISVSSFVRFLTSGFVLTLMNPMTMIVFMAIFAGFGWGKMVNGTETASFLVSGIFIGSLAWWGFLCGLVIRLQHLISDRLHYYFNIVTAFFVGAFGLYAMLSAALK